MDKQILEKNIYLRMIEFGINKPDGFMYKEIFESIKPNNWEHAILDKYLYEAYLNARNRRISNAGATIETPFFVIQIGNSDHHLHESYKYIISYDAHFKYLDYQELKFARENAKEAKTLAVKAIWISLAAILVSALIPLLIASYMTQSIQIDEKQVESILQKIK